MGRKPHSATHEAADTRGTAGRNAPWRLAALVLMGLALSQVGGGCSRMAYLDSVNAGRTFAYEPGVPNFDLEALATVRGGQAGIDLYLSIPHASLVFLPEAEEGYTARFEAVVRLFDRKGDDLFDEYAAVDTVRVPTYEATQAFVPYGWTHRFPRASGTYLVEVVVTDLHSEQTARRRQRVEVTALGESRLALSRIRMEARREGMPYAPLLSLHVPAGLDSMRTSVELYNTRHLEDLVVEMRLMRFESDTASAQPPYGFTIGQGFGLVRYDRADTLQVVRRRVQDLDEELIIEFDLPSLTRGIYRVDVRVGSEGGTGVPFLERRRDFAVRSASFPKITSLDEMVAALVYLAREHELEHIQAAGTPEEKKRRFDAFWGSIMPDRARAANLLQLYYSRIEEANLLYTTYKEGWKTDRGMIYTLFGSPLYVDTQLEYEVWRYSYDEQDPIGAFLFNRRRIYDSDGIFEAFMLEREAYYEAAWRRALQRWRRGDVL